MRVHTEVIREVAQALKLDPKFLAIGTNGSSKTLFVYRYDPSIDYDSVLVARYVPRWDRITLHI